MMVMSYIAGAVSVGALYFVGYVIKTELLWQKVLSR